VEILQKKKVPKKKPRDRKHFKKKIKTAFDVLISRLDVARSARKATYRHIIFKLQKIKAKEKPGLEKKSQRCKTNKQKKPPYL
jgi:hypothetical protein